MRIYRLSGAISTIENGFVHSYSTNCSGERVQAFGVACLFARRNSECRERLSLESVTCVAVFVFAVSVVLGRFHASSEKRSMLADAERREKPAQLISRQYPAFCPNWVTDSGVGAAIGALLPRGFLGEKIRTFSFFLHVNSLFLVAWLLLAVLILSSQLLAAFFMHSWRSCCPSSFDRAAPVRTRRRLVDEPQDSHEWCRQYSCIGATQRRLCRLLQFLCSGCCAVRRALMP